MLILNETAALVENVIVEKGGKFYVYSEDKTKKLGGPYDTREEAEKRLKQVEYFKHNVFSAVTVNLSGPEIKYGTLLGKRYMIVPMIMIVEGVHNGSAGPLLYPGEELAKTPEVWNHKPIVFYHPKGSACDVETLNNRQVGLVLGSRYLGGKLHAEAWLEEARLKLMDKKLGTNVLARLRRKEMVELSTGLFTDNEMAGGTWNGKEYRAVARNYRPDHLALLPDQRGACSIEDGAGLLRLNSNVCESCGQTRNKERSTMDKEKIVAELIKNSAWTEEDREWLMSCDEEHLKKMLPPPPKKKEPTANEDPKKKDPPAETKVAAIRKKEPTVNEEPKKKEEPKQLTLDELLQNASPDMRDMIVSGVKAHVREKKELIKQITANSRNVFTEEQLREKTLGELQGIAALAASPTSNRKGDFGGLGDLWGSKPEEPEFDDEPLVAPTLNFKND